MIGEDKIATSFL